MACGVSPSAAVEPVVHSCCRRPFRQRKGRHRRTVDELADLLALTRGVAGGPTAAVLHGLDVDQPVVAHILVPRSGNRPRPEGCRLHRVDLRADEVMVRDGLALTTPVRTLLDCARWLPVGPAVATADSALRRRVVTRPQLECAAAALPRSRPASAARRVAALADGRSESVLESLARVLLDEAGLPPPLPQFRVRDQWGVELARVNFAWPEARVVLEVDGFAYHSSRRDVRRDRSRANDLVLLGWRVLRFGWEEVVGHPERVVLAVRAALGC